MIAEFRYFGIPPIDSGFSGRSPSDGIQPPVNAQIFPRNNARQDALPPFVMSSDATGKDGDVVKDSKGIALGDEGVPPTTPDVVRTSEAGGDSAQPVRQPAVTTQVYRGVEHAKVENNFGHSFNRGFGDFSVHMQHSLPGTPDLDRTISKRVDDAKRNKRNKVVIVDLGAGRANFAREFLENPEIGRRSRGGLRGNSGRALEFIEVSDAPSPERHLHEEPITATPDSTADNTHVTARAVNYSVTSSQTVAGLLDHMVEPQVDLVVASNFMNYLHPELFRGVMRDSIEAVRPGGEVQIFGYATLAGSLLSSDDGHIFENETVFFPHPQNPDLIIPGVEVTNYLQHVQASDAVAPAELRDIIDKTYASLLSTDTFPQEDKEQLLRGISQCEDANLPALLEKTREMVTNFENLVRVKAVRAQKEAALDALAEEYAGSVTIDRSTHGIRVVKPLK